MNKRVAIVTGGSRGIGRGIVHSLADYGWQVVINYRRDQDAALETQQMAKSARSQTLTLQADIANLDDNRRLVGETVNHFGRIDITTTTILHDIPYGADHSLREGW